MKNLNMYTCDLKHLHITIKFIKIETSRNQGKYIEQVNCDQVGTKSVQLKHNLIKQEKSLRNDYNEHLTSK